jgi:hypothetical protein
MGKIVGEEGHAVPADYAGRRFRIVAKKERVFPFWERVGRITIGIVSVVGTLGCAAVLCKSVRCLLTKSKESTHFGILVPSSSLPNGKIFGEKYFEDGIRSGVSCYENYHWMPERTIREASSIVNQLRFENVLDFGCAKGFLVHAMRLLGKQAFGVDISEYAVKNCHPEVKAYVEKIESAEDIKGMWDLIIAKDVLEHIPKEKLSETLASLRSRCKILFVAVPLGDDNRYRIPAYEKDVTHVVREPENWWLTTIKTAGFSIKYFGYQFSHLKENWTAVHPQGNAFIVAE